MNINIRKLSSFILLCTLTITVCEQNKVFAMTSNQTEATRTSASSLNSKQKNVQSKFKKFYLYGPMTNPSIDLSNKSSLIKTYSQANGLLKTSDNGEKKDRQLYLDAWNALNSKEKSHREMQKIDKSYKDMILILDAAKSCLKFYEDVKDKKDILLSDYKQAKSLNSKSNNNLGARGKAYTDYVKAKKTGEGTSNSKRFAYLNEKYLDAVYYLNTVIYISENNLSKAKTECSKIKDSSLRKTAEEAIVNKTYTKNQLDVINKFKKFYLYGPMTNPSIDLSKTSNLITKYSQAASLLKTTENGTKYDRQLFLDSYNKLTKAELENPKMKEIKSEYDTLIKVIESSEAILKFYEDVKLDANQLILDAKKSNSLNTKENLKLGARGAAYGRYKIATEVEPLKTSKRMQYLNQKYCDTVNFLSIAKYISAGNFTRALEIADMIEDKTLNKIAIDSIYKSMPNKFIITPNSNSYRNKMEGRSSYNDYTKHYYLIRSYLEELEARGGGTLVLGRGTYSITNVLYVPSNVTIILEDGVVIKKGTKTGTDLLTPSKSIFQLISTSKKDLDKSIDKYNGEKNIKIIGEGNSTIDLNYTQDSIGIIIGHNSNIEVTGINFKHMYGGHFIELDASKDVKITKNTFSKSKPYGNLSKEAINIDTPDKLTGGFNVKWSKLDKTPNLNVYIENNRFSDLDRAIGTHKYSEGKYHANIFIRNNIIEKTRSDSIRIMNWENPVIENNTIQDINSTKTSTRGIFASGVKNPTIRFNTFINMPRTMQFSPWKNNDAGSEYAITYNSISEENKNNFKKNTIQNVSENFIRINHKYDDFTYPEKVYID